MRRREEQGEGKRKWGREVKVIKAVEPAKFLTLPGSSALLRFPPGMPRQNLLSSNV
jgi:hypothetical protein